MCLHCISEGAEIWFTSLGHHKKGEKRGRRKKKRWWRRVERHSSASVAFFFKIHISYGAFGQVDYAVGGQNKRTSVLNAEGGACCPAPRNVKLKREGRKKSLFVFRSSFQPVSGSFQVSAGLSWTCEVAGGRLQLHVQ